MRALPFFVLLLSACSTPGFTYEPARAELLRETVDAVIRPGYAAVRDRAVELHGATEATCAAPDEASVLAAREAWHALFVAWERTTAYQFGPSRDLGLGTEIAFAPTRPATIEANVAATEPITPAWVESLGTAGLGIFAAEYLLFSPEPAADVAARFVAVPRRCAYLVAMTEHLEANATELVTAWDAFGEDFATAGAPGNTTFPSQLRAVSILLTQVVAAVTSLKTMRLGEPLGDAAGGVPQPDAVRSPFAGATNDGLVAQLDGVRDAWTAGTDGHGLGGYVAMRSPALGGTVLAQMDASRAALLAIPMPLEDYVVLPDHLLATEAQLEIRTLERTLGADVAAALSITLTFTDADGD